MSTPNPEDQAQQQAREQRWANARAHVQKLLETNPELAAQIERAFEVDEMREEEARLREQAHKQARAIAQQILIQGVWREEPITAAIMAALLAARQDGAQEGLARIAGRIVLLGYRLDSDQDKRVVEMVLDEVRSLATPEEDPK